MAKVGMRHLVYAKVATETPGTGITYTGGADMAPARRGNVNFDRPDNPLYGDDVMQDNDNGITGVTVEVETTDLAAGVEAVKACAVLEKMLMAEDEARKEKTKEEEEVKPNGSD